VSLYDNFRTVTEYDKKVTEPNIWQFCVESNSNGFELTQNYYTVKLQNV